MTIPEKRTSAIRFGEILDFTAQHGTSKLLFELALGKVKVSPFTSDSVTALTQDVSQLLSNRGLHLHRTTNDPTDVPIDFRFLDLLLLAADDPEVHLGTFAIGVRVGPCARLPRLPALYPPKEMALAPTM